MKTLSQHINEGLLSADFDVPDLNVEPIKAVTPVLDRDGWSNLIDGYNRQLIPYKYAPRINQLIDSATELIDSIPNNGAFTLINKTGAWLNDAKKLKKVEINYEFLEEANDIRFLNGWLAKVNKNAAFVKLANALGGSFMSNVSEQDVPDVGKCYAILGWFLVSPNENACKQLETIVEKLSKIDKKVLVRFEKTGGGYGAVQAILTRHA